MIPTGGIENALAVGEARRAPGRSGPWRASVTRYRNSNIDRCTWGRIVDDPAVSGAVAFLVNFEVADKTVRFNITVRKSQIAEIDWRAKKERMSRPAYIAASAPTYGNDRRPVRADRCIVADAA